MDISSLDVSTIADEGRAMDVVNARGVIMRQGEKGDGEPHTITLLGRFSEALTDFDNKATNKRLDAARRGADRLTKEELHAEATDRLIIATKGWTFDKLDGKDFAFSVANARKLWSDPRFSNLRERAAAFIADDANFMKD